MRPPPTHCAAMVEPWRARPVPFCFHGLRPPPATSARTLVWCVPRRAFAIWRWKAWCIRSIFTLASKMSAGRSTCCTFSPSMLRTSAFISMIPVLQRLLLARLVDHDNAALAAWHSAVHADQVALCIDHHNLQVLGSHAIAAHMTGAAGTAIDAAW